MVNIKERIKRGEQVFGVFSLVPSPSITEIMAEAGVDFVIIDMEHGPIGYESAEEMTRAAEVGNMAAIIRTPANRSEYILHALDIGASGIQIPHVSTAEEARRAVQASKYYPRGERGYTPFSRAGRYGAEAKNHARGSNETTLVVANIEGQEGIGNIDSILQVDDIDVIFVGPYDLSQSMGKPGQVDDPAILEAIKKTAQLCQKHGKACGSFAKDKRYMDLLMDYGVQYVSYGVDTQLILGTFQGAQQAFKEQLKGMAHARR